MLQEQVIFPHREVLDYTFSPNTKQYNRLSRDHNKQYTEQPFQDQKIFFQNPFVRNTEPISYERNSYQGNDYPQSEQYRASSQFDSQVTQTHKPSQRNFIEEIETIYNLLQQVDHMPFNANTYRIISETINSHAREYYKTIQAFISNDQYQNYYDNQLSSYIQQTISNIEAILNKFQACNQNPVIFSSILQEKFSVQQQRSAFGNQRPPKSSSSSNYNSVRPSNQRRNSQTARIKDEITRKSNSSLRQISTINSAQITPRNQQIIGQDPRSYQHFDFEITAKPLNKILLDEDQMKEKFRKLNEELNYEIARNKLFYAGQIIEEMLVGIDKKMDYQNQHLINGIFSNLEDAIKELQGNKGSVISLYTYLTEINKCFINQSKPEKQENTNLRKTENSQLTHFDKIQIYKPRYTEQQNVRPSQSELIDLKLKFYNLALERKNQYEQQQGAKQYLLVDLFEEYIKQDGKDIQKFLDQKFTL